MDDTAALRIIEAETIGETYLKRADGEQNRKGDVELIMELMDRDPQYFGQITDCTEHNLHYRINSTRLLTELR